MPSRFFLLASTAVLAACFGSNQASAHDLQGRLTLLADSIKVEAWFSDETPAEGAIVVVTQNKTKVSEGKTDETGVCHLPKLSPGPYEASIELIGHREIISFQVSETSGNQVFINWRMNKTLATAIGIGGLVVVSTFFWLFSLRKRPQPAGTETFAPEFNQSPSAGQATDTPPSSHRSSQSSPMPDKLTAPGDYRSPHTTEVQ
jgi:hypothetical protein